MGSGGRGKLCNLLSKHACKKHAWAGSGAEREGRQHGTCLPAWQWQQAWHVKSMRACCLACWHGKHAREENMDNKENPLSMASTCYY